MNLLKKLKNVIMCGILVCATVPTMLVFAGNYTQDITLGGNPNTKNYAYTVPEIKQNSSQSILLICQSTRYESSYSLKTCKVLPQNCSTKYGTYYADSKSLTYIFKDGFDQRLTNGIPAGNYARLRFAMEPTMYRTFYSILRYYY